MSRRGWIAHGVSGSTRTSSISRCGASWPITWSPTASWSATWRSGDQKSFATLQQALAYLGKVDGWPILVEPQLDGGRYIISVRAGVRRGKLPASLRALLFWTDDWQRVSKWYSWSLPV